MKVAWTKGLDAQEKDEITQLFASSARLRQRLCELLEEKGASLRKRNTIEDAYNNPNWALKQADAVGYERAMQEIMSLLK